jgi:MATE family multidrug resistance protein
MDGRQGSISSANAWMPPALKQSRSRSNGSADIQVPDETTRLLPNRVDEENGYDLEDDESKSNWQLVLHEFWVLFRGSIPVILAYTLQNSLQTISVLIVGRLSPEALATAAFAYMFAMATGWLIALGGTTAIDTLASATFTGSKNPHDLGIILQRAFIVLFIFYIPVVLIWGFAEPIFEALGQEAYLAHDAARFLAILVPGGLGYIYFEALKKFLQAQGTLIDRNFVACLIRIQKSCALALTCS